MNIPEEQLISSEQQLKAYLHPQRMKMLKVLAEKPITLTMLAASLGTIPANLSRHLRALEAAGLVKLVEKRETARNIEKYYLASARSYRVDPSLGGAERARSALSLLREGLEEAERSGRDDALALLLSLRLRDSSRDELIGKLRAVIEEYRGRDEEGGEGLALSVALYGSEKADGGTIVL